MRPAHLALLAAVVLGADPVRAERPPPLATQPLPRSPVTAHLDYTLGPGAGNCPDASYLRQEVSRRIGHDSFASDAQGVPLGTVRVVIARSPKGLTATYDLFDPAGAKQWTRTYSEPSTIEQACRDINQGIATELAGEFQLLEAEQAEKTPPAPPQPPPAPEPVMPPAPPARCVESPPPAVPPATPAPSHLRVRGEVEAAVLVGGGMTPSPTVGGALHLGAALLPANISPLWFSVGLEGRADTPVGDAPNPLSSRLLGVSGLGCIHGEAVVGRGVLGYPFVCVVGAWASVHAAREALMDGAAFGLRNYMGVGARVGFELRPAPFLSLVTHAELRGTAIAAHLVDWVGREAWRTPEVSGELGVGARFSFEIPMR